MIKKPFLLVAITTLLMGVAPLILARDYATIKNSGELLIGTTGDYPPLTYLNPKTQQLEGDSIDVISVFAKYQDLKPKFVMTQWKTLSSDLKAQKFDIAVGGITHSPERAEAFLFTQPIDYTQKVALIRCSDRAQLDSLDKINNAKIRVIENKGGTNEQFAKKYLTQAQLTVVSDNIKTLDYLLKNQADVMVTDATEARYRMALYSQLCIGAEFPFTQNYHAFMVNKEGSQLQAVFDQWLEDQRFHQAKICKLKPLN